jgi:hypothetical protein
VTETTRPDDPSSPADADSDATDRGDESRGGTGRSDVEALRSARAESRAVLDHHVQDINAMDDTALRIGRVAVVILGLLVSSAGLLGTDRLETLPTGVLALFGSGALVLLVTLIVSIVTYTDSELDVGIDRTWREEVREEAYTEEEWLDTLLGGYDEWIEGLQQVQSTNRLHLLVTQFLLVMAVAMLLDGLVLLTLGIGPAAVLLALVSGAVALFGSKWNI